MIFLFPRLTSFLLLEHLALFLEQQMSILRVLHPVHCLIDPRSWPPIDRLGDDTVTLLGLETRDQDGVLPKQDLAALGVHHCNSTHDSEPRELFIRVRNSRRCINPSHHVLILLSRERPAAWTV
jgi:hypothetical protein